MKILKFITSIPVMIVLCLIFALSIGIATFIENAYGTETARALIYNAKWLEAVYVFLVINLIGNLIRFKLWRKGKRLIGLFHFSFLIILCGAAFTRYMGHGYTLHFREGETTNQLLSDHSFLKIEIKQENQTKTEAYPLRLSAITHNRWQKSIKIGSETLRIRLKKYLRTAVPVAVEDSFGGPLISLSIYDGQRSMPLLLRQGDQEKIGNMVFQFTDKCDSMKNRIIFSIDNDLCFIQSDMDLNLGSMRQDRHELLPAGTQIPLEPGLLFSIGHNQFALQSWLPRGRISAQAVEKENPTTKNFALLLTVFVADQSSEIALFGGSSIKGIPEILTINNMKLTFTYGALSSSMPFYLHLNDFILERYPGSPMPSAYESQVTIYDPQLGIKDSMEYQIYMNHILKHRGYRFYQSAYDDDEQGSILSVTRDPGTPVTYVGYAILMICLVINLLNPKSRFRLLGKLIRSSIIIAAFMIIPSDSCKAQESLLQIRHSIDKRHAGEFGRLIVQDQKGRMKPVNSLACEILGELNHPEKQMHLSPDQWMLIMYTDPAQIKDMPLIPVNHIEINQVLGLDIKQKKFAPSVFDDPVISKKFDNRILQVMTLPEHARSASEKEMVQMLKSLNAYRKLQQGNLFRFFPVPGQPSQWVSENDGFLDEKIQKLIVDYKQSVNSQEWQKANLLLSHIKNYQCDHGQFLIPSAFRRETEIAYNKCMIFERTGPYLLWIGILLFVWLCFILFIPSYKKIKVTLYLTVLLCIGFGFQNAGLIMRWIASGHAPWTNKYESLIYIAWAVMFAGILFSRNNRFSLALAAILSGSLLKIASLGWADPVITNLVPVLKSHWLISHVSIITASYGFFSLSAMLGILTLLLICIPKKTETLDHVCQKLSYINERYLLIGLTLVMIGNLLGAIWANESWGRYWGWDPKETWTLIIILAYTVVIHLRLIPTFSYRLVISIGSIFAFWTVLMTYWGVNLYLSGMHSYAAEEAQSFPMVLLIIFGIQYGISLWATLKTIKK